MDEELQTAGQRMRWLRMARDMNQTELGRQAFISQRMVSHFELDRYVPRPLTRQRIAEALGVHQDFIWRAADLVKRKRVAA